jgi:hypothetical protein
MGRRQGKRDVIAYHICQSFPPGEITPEETNRIGYELAMRFTKGRHAFIVCTHTDRTHIHNHLIWNSTTLDCRGKFRNFIGSSFALWLTPTECVMGTCVRRYVPMTHAPMTREPLKDGRQSLLSKP